MEDNYSEKDPLIGRVIGGKFKIGRKMGLGGMATVYQATQINLGREIALKIIHPNLVNDSESVSRFYREAQDLASLSHPNIVTVYDFGSEDIFHFISMEYLKGKNLAEIIRQEGRLDELRTIKYLASIADALNHLHQKGLVHRDIKCSNIFITSDDRPVLMDFGIAFHQDKTISMSGAILGTAEFMSPEQASGNDLDGRSDIYSLGIVMYECVTGRVPFYSDSPTATLYKVVHERPPIISKNINVSKELKNIIFSSLEKDPSRRPQNGKTIYDTLNSLMVTSGPMPPLPGKKKIRTNIIVFILGLIMISLIGLGLNFKSRKDTILKQKEIQGFINQGILDYSRNNYIDSHRSFWKAFLLDSTNAEIRKRLTECRNSILNVSILPYLVSIPGSTFNMGNDNGGNDEKPMHQVTLSSFRIGRTEVNNQQFARFLNAMDCDKSGMINGMKAIDLTRNTNIFYVSGLFITRAGTENLPAIGITWTGADLFCRTFSGRLPTEAEWEYAASCGKNQKYSGSDDLDKIAWYIANSNNYIKEIGTKLSNEFGLFDLSGNAWEWCQDYYDKAYYRRSPNQNPMGPEKGNTKVIRGGDYRSRKESMVNTFRSNSGIAGSSGDAIGFRICLPLR